MTLHLDLYGVMYEGELMGVLTSTAEGGDGEPVIYEFYPGGEQVWLTNSAEKALRAATESSKPAWAGSDWPINRHAGECEVVKVTLTTSAAT